MGCLTAVPVSSVMCMGVDGDFPFQICAFWDFWEEV